MYVEGILNFSKPNREADLRISDGKYSVICYAYPIEQVEIGQNVNSLYGFGCKDIVNSSENKFHINKLSQYYTYHVIAKVISKKNSIVHVGGLAICIDGYIPNDISDGDYISFCVTRFDY